MTVIGAAKDAPQQAARRRRSPQSWVRGGGLSTLVFLLPMLLIFGVFSWFPIVRAVVMSLQQTNLVTTPNWVGLDNFRTVLADPLLWTAVRNTAYFAALALIFGYPIPLILAVLMSEAKRWRGLMAGLAYLPVVVPPVVAVLLWKFFYDASPDRASSTPSSAGWAWGPTRGCRLRRPRCPRSCSSRPGPTPAAR